MGAEDQIQASEGLYDKYLNQLIHLISPLCLKEQYINSNNILIEH